MGVGDHILCAIPPQDCFLGIEMANIVANNLSLHYRLSGQGRAKLSGATAPKNLIEIGRKKYILALKELNFKIENGQRVGLVGRNGSGKSTLLRVLGGVYPPTGGSLSVSGQVSSMFNLSLGVQAEASGRDNIIIRGLVKGWRRSEIEDHMDEIIDFSELRDFIDLPLRTYSDGMRMRLLFAIATSFSPEVLLLDEWIGAGDSSFQAKAAERMGAMVDKAGIVVIASHSRALLLRVCDRAIWLDQGVLRAYGDIEDVFAAMDEGISG